MNTTRLQPWMAFAGACACAVSLHAQVKLTGHYPAGVEGIKAGSVPPPGIYLRDYNLFYQASDLAGVPGVNSFDLFAYVNAPRVIWITEKKFMGADYGLDALIPIAYTEQKVNGARQSSFAVGDLCVEPVILGWHGAQYDFSVAYGVWAPTGDFDLNNLTKPGKGFWSQMVTLGGTYYFDKEKTWAISMLNRYEFHLRNGDIDVTPGQSWTVEYGLSKTVRPGIDIGVVGYWTQQVTDDSGPGLLNGPGSQANPSNHYRVGGVGPEISAFCAKLGMIFSARYMREFDANLHPEGGTGLLTVTKRF